MANAATLISINAPATVQAGDQFQADITYQNSGTTDWTTANYYRLGSESPRDNKFWSAFNRIELPASPVAPGSQATFSGTFTAPSAAGTYPFAWAMVQDYVGWFGPIASQQITVEGSAPPPPEPPPAGVPILTQLPVSRTDPSDLIGVTIVDTTPYGQMNTPLELLWIHEGSQPFEIRSSYLWSGVAKGLICDCHCELTREADGTQLNVLQWDRYAEPTAPNNHSYRDYPGYHLINPGEKLKLLYYTNNFNNPSIKLAHHRVALWGVYR